MQRTTVTNENHQKFYKSVYPVLGMSKCELINLELYPGEKVLFDSVGWHYQKHFLNERIIKLENLQTCKQYHLDSTQFDKLFTDNKIPSMTLSNSTLVIDHSAYFKYRTVEVTKSILTDLIEKINPNIILFRLPLSTTDDYRFTDRLKNLVNIIPDSFITNNMSYNTNVVFFDLKKKTEYDIN